MSRKSLSFPEFAALAGAGETGWRRLALLENVCHFSPWDGPTGRLGLRVSEHRLVRLRELVASARRTRPKERAAAACARYEAELDGKHEKAVRNRTLRDLEWLTDLGTITRDAHRRGVVLTPARGVRIGKVKGSKSRVYLPPIVLERLRGVISKVDKSGHQKGADPGTRSGQMRAPKQDKSGHHDDRSGHHIGAPDVSDSGTSHIKEFSDLSQDSQGDSPLNKLREEPTASAGSDLISSLDGDPFGMLTGEGATDADVWLSSPGVPPYPSERVVGAVVRVPPPPEVRPEHDQAARLAMLGSAYRAAVRYAYRRRDPDWTPPKRFWRPWPKAPKDGADPSPAALRYLECAAMCEKHRVPPHVWCLHRVESWIEIQQGSLAKPPPIKYVFDPALIRKQRGWVRGLSDNYASARQETAPKARELTRRWTMMRSEFFSRRVASADEAAEVAAAFFPDGEFERRCEDAREEARVMTEMHVESIDEGEWVWQ